MEESLKIKFNENKNQKKELFEKLDLLRRSL